jgi:hypothetical protein
MFVNLSLNINNNGNLSSGSLNTVVIGDLSELYRQALNDIVSMD